MILSKSKYTKGVICKKALWLSCYKDELKEEIANDTILLNGKKVGELARGLFGDYELINFDSDHLKMVNDTCKAMNNMANIICEASFIFNKCFCSVDILKNDIDGVEIYEVKASTKINKIYYKDIAYQTWILKKIGINVKKSYIVYVNNKYIKEGSIDLNKYFVIEDVTDKIDLDVVNDKVKELIKVINSDEEPSINLSIDCYKPYNELCPFFNYCTKNLPKPNVFNIGWGTHFSKKIDLYYNNVISYEDILRSSSGSKKVINQVKFELNKLAPKIDRDKIEEFMKEIKYPLYFLDFESLNEAIPSIDGTKPYQQICFQYSLHYYLEDGKTLYHKEYLSDEYYGNPMYGLCKSLCEDIPKDACVLVYNESFEKNRLKEMANMYEEFSDHLLNIRDNIVDLSVIFKNQYYYKKEMAGSYSIKVVLPALFPDDETLDYHKLEQVHKGDEASEAFLSLKNLSKEEEMKLRENMLKYCKLDTYAMVKIYDKLKEVIENR